ncbi:galactosyl transferase GMA12/MNN10 family-domain-containing protein [Limtongia smithiae]|uniref:galactosyl transferase GMA12/MNN10 family-domain-containing protein n=1 Tax=Limtongia smithiae TaxID=1125753 RepID=UPI0034CD6624
MHFSIPNRSSDHTTLPGSPTFKAKSRASSHRTSYGPSFLSRILSPILHPLPSSAGGGGGSTAFEKKRRATRRTTTSLLVLVIFVVALFFFALVWLISSSGSGRSANGPHVVLVLGIDDLSYKDDYTNRIIANRQEYANAHGYALYTEKLSKFQTMVKDPRKKEWMKLPLLRYAIAAYPDSTFFWYLDQNAIIMNPNLSIEDHITDPRRLNSLMLRDIPVVPPDSTIRTYRHVPADRIKFIISQDHEGFQTGSFILKNEEYAKYVLDAWSDRLYQEYSFKKAEESALEHIAQWHPTVLSKLAVIPQRVFNAYPNGVGDASYQDGDFVASLAGCDTPERSCVREFERLWDSRGRVVPQK